MTKHVCCVLESVHPSMKLTVKGMNVMNDILGDFYEHVMQTARELQCKVGH